MSYISLFNETIIEGGVQAAEFGSLTLTDESNQLTLNKTIINDEETVGRTITIPSTNEDCEFVLTSDIGQIIAGNNTFTGLNTFTQKTTFSNPTEGISVDKIVEYTTDGGVNIDGMVIKDGAISFSAYGWSTPLGLLQAPGDGSVTCGSTFIMSYRTMDLEPTTDDSFSLGTSLKRYRNIYGLGGIFNNLYSPSSGSITLWTDIIPQTSGILNLGSDSLKFYRLYTDELKLYDALIGYTGATGTFNIPNYNSTTNFILKDTTAGSQTINGSLTLGGYTGSQYLKTNVSGLITGQTTIPNSDTTATASNIPSTIVLRDGTGLFSCSQVNCRNIGGGVKTIELKSISFGDDAFLSRTSGDRNSALGYESLKLLTTASDTVGCGAYALSNVTTASGNVAVGSYALYTCNTNNNVAVGVSALIGLTGSGGSGNNVGIGAFVGSNYAGNEQNNILLVNSGVTGESNTIRIGNSTHTSIYLPTLTSTGIVHSSSDGQLTSSLITNSDIDGAAGISYSKLNLLDSITNSDINVLAGISYSKLDLVNSVKAADIDSETATNGYVLTADGSGNATWSAAGGSSNAATIDITNTGSGSFYYPTFTDSTGGSTKTLRADSALQYNATSEVLQVTNTFTNIYCTNTTSAASWFPVFSSGGNNYFGLNVSTSALSFQPSTSTLTCTNFAGNATTATSATSATTATNANNVNLGATAGTLNYLLMSSATTGNQPIYTDTGITYNASTNNLSATTFTGDFLGTINTATTATLQTAATNNSTVATTQYTDRAVANVFVTLPTDLYTSGGYIIASTAAGTFYCISPGIISRTGGGQPGALLFDLDTSSFPSLSGRTAKLRCKYIVTNNNVTNPLGVGGSISCQLQEVTAVGGTTQNINYTLGGTNYGQQSFILGTASVINKGTSSTFTTSSGTYLFTYTTSATTAAGVNISVTAKLQLIYE